MSTSLHMLQTRNNVRRIDIELPPGEVPQRRLFATDHFKQWADTISDEKKSRTLLSPKIELLTVLIEYISGSKIVTSLHWINPRKHGCVSLQTMQLRLVGWVPEPQTLILCDGAHVSESHGSGTRTKSVLARSIKQQRQAFGVLDWCAGELHELFIWSGST